MIFNFCSFANARDWKKIDSGISYTHIGSAHLFQIDLQRYRLSITTATEIGLTNTTAKNLALHSKAVLAINGGFFSMENKSLGLILRDGKTINPLHPTSWWAIFYLQDQKSAIVLPSGFRKNKKMEMALQVGPRLVIDGKIPNFKPSLARRSGIGIKKDGKIVIAVTEEELSMEDFAKIFVEAGCLNALNLDGGGSTQLYFNQHGFKLDIPGPSLITNAITVLPRY